jgi:hypothetical protein
MLRRAWLSLTISLLAPSAAAAPQSATFAFEDARYLRSGDREGGLVHAPGADDSVTTDPLPLLVFLHGVNESGPLHRGLGAGAFDLRAVVEDLAQRKATRPFAVAGPSQNKEAWTGSRLWSGFDLDAFVDAVEAALPSGGRIDRERVVVAGHSGAGCNTSGGLLAPAGKIEPLAILALDTCMDAEFGKLFGEASRRAPVFVFHQTALWPRDVGAFTAAFEAARGDGEGAIEKLEVTGPNPHDDVVPIALRRALPRLFPLEHDDS